MNLRVLSVITIFHNLSFVSIESQEALLQIVSLDFKLSAETGRYIL